MTEGISGKLLLSAALALGAAAPAAVPAAAQEEAAVLAKGSGPYFEGYMAMQKALGRPVVPHDLSKGKPRLGGGLKTVVAFGAKAAALNYPKGVRLIYALSPGYTPGGMQKDSVRIGNLPEPAEALRTFKDLQPDLKKLAVISTKGPLLTFVASLEKAARDAGVVIVARHPAGPGELPDALRSLQGEADALWLLCDPALITRTSLSVLAEFSCSHKLPLYVPSSGLVEFGAAAAYAPGIEATGAAAADILEAVLAGRPVPGVVHPEASLTVNRETAVRCGLPLKLPPGGKP